MWFDPSELVHSSFNIAISAIPATNPRSRDLKVANIATLAAHIEPAMLTFGSADVERLDQVADLIPCPPSMQTHMTVQEEAAIRNWLGYIEECEPEIIISKCRVDQDALRYFCERAIGIPLVRITPELHSCNDCARLNQTGICAAATKLGAMPGYRPILGRRFDHRCQEWAPP